MVRTLVAPAADDISWDFGSVDALVEHSGDWFVILLFFFLEFWLGL